MKTSVKITFLDEEGQKFFGVGPARLLCGIEACGSLRAAAMQMDMAYTKALKLVKQMETALGYPVVTRTIGGKDGGGSVLTPQGKRWLMKYEAYRLACVQECQKLYETFFTKTGCVIMASGMGVRFGGNKLMADFGGEPMILRAIHATEGLFEKRVVVTRHEEIAKLCRDRDIEVVLHSLPHRSDTIRLGLEALGEAECCLFCPGDQPLLRWETVENLLTCWEENRENIIRPVCDGEPGSPVLFPKWTFSELLALPEGKGGGFVIKKHLDKLKTVHIADALELMDADTPEILEQLRQYAGKLGATMTTAR